MARPSYMKAAENAGKQKEQRYNEYRAQRDDLSATIENGILVATTDPARYQTYLDLQAINLHMTTGNVISALEHMPDAKEVHPADTWQTKGRQPRRGAAAIPVFGPKERGYPVVSVYDVSQTTGSTLPAPVKLTGQELGRAIEALIASCPVEVVPDKDVEGVFYDPDSLTIMLGTGMTDPQAFQYLAEEVYQAKVHNRGNNPYYDHAENAFDAMSAGYAMCKRYGIEGVPLDFSPVTEIYSGVEAPADRRVFLDQIRNHTRQMSNIIDRELTPEPPQRGRIIPTRNTGDITR